MKRTNYCGEVTASLLGTKQTLCGWVNSYRNHGGVLFIDLRDRSGICQVVVEPSKPFFAEASAVRNEYVIEVTGTVKRRIEGAVNKNMKTGEIELVADEFKVLNSSIPLPFDVEKSRSVAEEIRLKYRYLDLRNPQMFANLLLRHRIMQAARRYLDGQGFLEVETPILTRSTPEGARDYLVPSRVHHGEFYALPQSPQMFKQTLMASGIDRYFQLVLRPEAQQIRNVIREAVETSLMDRSCRLAIDFYLRIGHHTFENDAHLFVFPRFRYPEIMPVDAIFIVEIVLAISIVLLFAFTLLINIVASVGIATESLLFPTGGYFDGVPFFTVHSFRTPEVPRYGMFRIRSGEILHFGLLRPCRK